ncbi:MULTISPECIES: DUF488 domain-containing protein [Methylorubrum]|jgi:uncharacterized protein (DUF488 family)|uniref:DUF488 domain-containing protein n=2 Tax=Methylorubrum TaxID=2282523 RepID=B1ZEU3_METPB|nr:MULTISPECIES: DUF488 domain-containing protein [Methylorubrum]ACB82472.1 protein of unknown function DUF1130 [Methylorubrum populi BJ001]MBA8913716.1 uncharacterized protein (DUF488 family) [Methylorubrum thiocyanatum]OAH30084.1 hypothetical protein AX289_19205 [Methylorubrum populi]PZP70137.1 MAG: DUF488 domain-containing protein [Methylorubrum populi]GJE82108.1 hypothetical protein CJNNKLLH_3467 [Methylorubrum thiocyanatum]
MRKTLFTIGYEGLSPDRLHAALKAADVAVLADVRAVANSRKRGFSKGALKAGLVEAGLGYEHFRSLGTPKSGREAARAHDAGLMRRIYCEEVLDTADGGLALDALADLAAERPVCLLCFERDPARCHRRVLAERLAPRGFETVDLYGDFL